MPVLATVLFYADKMTKRDIMGTIGKIGFAFRINAKTKGKISLKNSYKLAVKIQALMKSLEGSNTENPTFHTESGDEIPNPTRFITVLAMNTIGPGKEVSVDIAYDASIATLKVALAPEFGLEPQDFHLHAGVTCDEQAKISDYVDVSRNTNLLDAFLLIPASTAGANPTPALRMPKNIKYLNKFLIKTIAIAHLELLIDDMPVSFIREVLIENGIITKYEGYSRKSKAAYLTRTDLMNKIDHYNLKNSLIETIFNRKSDGYSWSLKTAQFINAISSGYYRIGKHLFAHRFQNAKLNGKEYSLVPIRNFPIDKLTDYFINVQDSKISLMHRMKVLQLLELYASEIGLNRYEDEDVNDKIMWLLGKALQQVISNNFGEYISLTSVSSKVFGYGHVFGTGLKTNLKSDKKTFETVRDYIEKKDNKGNNIFDKKDINYINSILEALAYAKDVIFYTEKNPKKVEMELIRLMSEKLGVLKISEGWKYDKPNMKELAKFFGVSKSLFRSIRYYGYDDKSSIYRVFSQDDLDLFAERIKLKLAPVDPAGAKEILVTLGAYDPVARRAELIRQFPTLESKNQYEDKSIYGDSASNYPPKWNRKSWKARMKLSLAYSQGLHSLNGKEYFFDGFTGELVLLDDPNVEIHHIGFHKSDSTFNDLVLAKKGSTHRTKFANTEAGKAEKLEYIANGKIVKLALNRGQAPRIWSLESQAHFKQILRSRPRSKI